MNLKKKIFTFLGTIALSLGISSCATFTSSLDTPLEEELGNVYLDASDNGYFKSYDTFLNEYFSNPTTLSKAKKIKLESIIGTYSRYSFLTEDGYQGLSDIRTSTYNNMHGYYLYCALNPDYLKNESEWFLDIKNDLLPEPTKVILDITYNASFSENETLILNKNSDATLKRIPNENHNYFSGYKDLNENTYVNSAVVTKNMHLSPFYNAEITTGVITNKEFLQSTWRVNDSCRKVEALLNSDPYITLDDALCHSEIGIYSSEPNVIGVIRDSLHAGIPGTSIITLANKNNVVLDTVIIEVKEEIIKTIKINDIMTNPFADIRNRNDETRSNYIIDGIVVSVGSKGIISIYDGTGIMICNLNDALNTSLNVGDKIKVTGHLHNFFGAIEILVNAIEPSTNTLTLPKLEVFNEVDCVNLQNEQIKNNDTIIGEATRSHYVELELVLIETLTDNAFLKTKNKGLDFRTIYTNAEINQKIDNFKQGNVLKVTGTIKEYNSKYNVFNILINDVTFLEEGATTINALTISAIKTQVFVNEKVKLSYSTEPSLVFGKIEYNIISKNNVVKLQGDTIIGVAPGEAIIQGTYLGVKSNELTITIIKNDVPFTSVKDLYALNKLNSVVRTKGQIRYINKWTNEYYIQDGDYAICIKENELLSSDLHIGASVEVQGTLNVTRGNLEINKATSMSVDYYIPITNESYRTNLSGIDRYYGHKRVSFRGTISTLDKLDSNNEITLKLCDNNEIKVNLKYTEAKELYILTLCKTGDLITIDTIITFDTGIESNELTDDKKYLVVNCLTIKQEINNPELTFSLAKNVIDIGETMLIDASTNIYTNYNNVSFKIFDGTGLVDVFALCNRLYIKGLKEGNCNVRITIDSMSADISLTVNSTNVDPYQKAKVCTFNEFKSIAVPGDSTLYKVTGVINKVLNKERGSVEIIEKGTNSKIEIDNLGDKRSFNIINGSLRYYCNNHFEHELLNKKFSLGDEITLYIIIQSKTNLIEGAFESVVSNVSQDLLKFNNLPEYIVPDKVDGYHFGEDFTLTVDNTKLPAGKKVIYISLNNDKLLRVDENRFIGKITFDLDLAIGLGNANAEIKETIINSKTLGLTKRYPTSEVSTTVGDLSLKYHNIGEFNAGIMQCRRDSSYIFLTKEAPYEIDSITVVLKESTMSYKLDPHVLFSTSLVIVAPKAPNLGTETLRGTNTFTFINNVSGAKYFALNFYGLATYVDSIVITYK